jgi:hypothetical protein
LGVKEKEFLGSGVSLINAKRDLLGFVMVFIGKYHSKGVVLLSIYKK